ncbi:hypothetical protein PTKIN_Ptkin11bG0070000 [Pterospermum kingtungense]
MTRQVLIRSPPVIRRQPDNPKTAKNGKKFGEVAGGTAAECAAVCCCCPCSVMELLVLALYKVPTGLFKKAWRRRKRKRLMKKKPGLLSGTAEGGPTREEVEAELDRMVGKGEDEDNGCTGTVDIDKEMWDRFYGTGFWRSPSQRDT